MPVKLHVKNFQSIKNAKVTVDGFTVIHGPNNSGKALAQGTPVATPQGWRSVEDISCGDFVLAGDGTPTEVVGVYPQGLRDTCEISFDDGRMALVDLDHLWVVSVGEGRFSKKGPQRWTIWRTKDLWERVGDAPTAYQRPAVPQAGVAQYQANESPLDPYLLGVLLGDGCLQKTSVRVSSADAEIFELVKKTLPNGVSLNPCGKYDRRIRTPRGKTNPVLNVLRDLGLAGKKAHEKFIPPCYQWNTSKVRVALLQGLMDTDGTVSPQGGLEFSTSSEQLASGFQEMVYSLGGTARIRQRIPSYLYAGIKLYGRQSFTVSFRLGMPVFRLKRKIRKVRPLSRRLDPLMVSFKAGPCVPCVCLKVAHPDHLFQIGGHIVTHNTALVRAIRGVFQNTKGTAFVRYGAAKCSVLIDLGDGNTVQWEKGPKIKPTYVINKGSPIHPGQAVPDEVAALGVRPLRLSGNREVWPQVAPQFTGQVFLLDQPGSVVAEAIADVERVTQLNTALKLADSDKRSASQEVKIRKKDLAELEQELESLAGLDDVIQETEGIESQVKKVTTLEKAVAGLTILQTQLIEAQQKAEALAGVSTVDVPPTEALSLLQGTLGELGVLEDLRVRLDCAKANVEVLAGVSTVDVPLAESFSLLQGTLGELEVLEDLGELLDSSKANVKALEPITKLAGDVHALSTKVPERALDALGVVEDLQKGWVAAQAAALDAKVALTKVQTEAKESEDEVHRLLDELGMCPVCGTVTSELDA